MTRLVFDINEPTYPVGFLLIRLTDQMYQEGTTYLHGRPMGFGQIVVDKDQTFVTATNFAVGNYVIVRDLDLSANDAENAIGGFWLEEGDFKLVSDDPKVLQFGGRSTIAVLERAIMGPEALDPEWPLNVNEDGYWRWGNMSHGGIMRRSLFEANLQDPAGLPMITTSHVGPDDIFWDDTNDSNGNPWPEFVGEYRTQCGTNLLELYRELYGFGVQLEIDPQSFAMYAFNPDGYGTNRTSATFAVGKVRFVGGVNIAADLTRKIHGRLRTTHLLVRTTDYPEGGWIESDDYTPGDPVYKRVYQTGDISGDPATSTVLQDRAQRNMDLRTSGEDAVRIPLAKTGDDEANGVYTPGPNYATGPTATTGHFWTGDLITLDTGDHTMDYQDASKRVEAVEYVLREAGDWDVVVHLGPRTFLQNSSVPSLAGATSHTLPLELCDPDIASLETSTAWKVTASGVVPPGWHEAGFDDSAYGDAVQNSNGVYHDPGSRWIWEDSGDQGSGEERAFRREFTIRRTPRSLSLTVAADNGCEVYVNGTLVASVAAADRGGASSNNGSVATTVAVDPSLLTVGTNCMSIIGWNETNTTPPAPGPAAVYAVLTVTSAVGTSNRAERCGHGHHALDIPYYNGDSGLTADNLQEAVDEIVAGGLEAYLTASGGEKHTVNVVAASGTTETLNLADGNWHDVTLTANCTFTFAGATNGVGCVLYLILRQDGTGGRTVTWPASVAWPDDIEPTLASGANELDIFWFRTTDGGTTWFGEQRGAAGGGGHDHSADAYIWKPLLDDDGAIVTDGNGDPTMGYAPA